MPIYPEKYQPCPSQPQCFECGVTEEGYQIKERSIQWIVRPRAKNGGGSYLDVFRVDLCDFCFSLLPPDAYTIGWDWWDAADGLCEIREKIDEAKRAHWKRLLERGY